MPDWLELILDKILSPIAAFLKLRRNQYKNRLQELMDKEDKAKVSNAVYNKTIFSHFVSRRFRAYDGGTEELKIRKILAQIEGIDWYNLFLTGAPGMGKTTALKWLYLHGRFERPPVFLYAFEFKNCATLGVSQKKRTKNKA